MMVSAMDASPLSLSRDDLSRIYLSLLRGAAYLHDGPASKLDPVNLESELRECAMLIKVGLSDE